MNLDDGGPAFPELRLRDDPDAPIVNDGGMSLRDWFAGQALTGILANMLIVPGVTHEERAKAAYQLADAMLTERER